MNQEWSEKNKQMQNLLKRNTFQEGVDKLIELRTNLMEEILSWRADPDEFFSLMPYPHANGYHSKTVAYSLWHIFRIEDIVVNSLIRREEEVLFAGSYQEKMNAPIKTTGNELVGSQMEEFSRKLNIEGLYQYIEEVKRTTEEWLKTLKYEDLKTSYSEEDKEYLRKLGVVGNEESAAWLIDFWCDKDIKGLIKMPLSRHWIMHIEASLRIRKKLR